MEFRCCNILEAALGMVLEPSQFSRTEKRGLSTQVSSYADIAVYITRLVCLSVEAVFDGSRKISFV
jgi:hypothetical protein